MIKIEYLEDILRLIPCDCPTCQPEWYITRTSFATLVVFKMVCLKCGKAMEFQTDDKVNRKPRLSLSLAMAVMATGSEAEKVVRLFRSCKILVFSPRVLYHAFKASVVPTIEMVGSGGSLKYPPKNNPKMGH